ncbi:MAG: PepSY domain-containing protein [Thermaurantiacus tibetensis]|uniref:PepSY domain-containing protein n=1 Tax=Thermaurantiacus tibetensis TaxID=2759035 RepID=UPI001890B2FE|nr:hypothetical protein [Thermaurantiacus tibetensis]
MRPSRLILAVLVAGAVLPVAAPAGAEEQGAAAIGREPARPVSDQDMARTGRERGEILPLDVLMSRAQRYGRGDFLGVETGSFVYRFKFRRPAGEVVWVDLDSRSGNLVALRQ